MKASDSEQAYLWWYRYYEFAESDKRLEPFLLPNENLTLREARLALLVSSAEMASRLHLTRASYIKLEQRENLGRVRLCELARAAEKMDCELVYAIRPKEKILFSQLIFRILSSVLADHPWVSSRPYHLKARALAAVARRKLDEPKFRREHRLTERRAERGFDHTS